MMCSYITEAISSFEFIKSGFVVFIESIVATLEMTQHFTTSTIAVRDQAKHWERILGYRPQASNNTSVENSLQTGVPLPHNSEPSHRASLVLKPHAKHKKDQLRNPKRRECQCTHSSSSHYINCAVPSVIESSQIQQMTSASRVEIANLVSSSAENEQDLNLATSSSRRKIATPIIPPKPFGCKYCSRSYSHARSLQVCLQVIYSRLGYISRFHRQKCLIDRNINCRHNLTFQTKTFRHTMLKGIVTSKQTSVQLMTANCVSLTNPS